MTSSAEWQSIETAPKDGTAVDVYFPIRSVGDALLYGSGRMTGWSYEDGKWGPADGGLSRLFATDGSPSHWMPIPEPPK